MRRRTRQNNLSYSMLETRRLLAGDVNVAVDGTNLMVTGDNQANQVDITRNQTGVLVVSGLNTTINGTNNPFVAIPNVLSINITLDGGNDETTIDNVLLHKDLNFFGNEGNDRLTVTDSYAGRLYIESGSGNDVLDLDLITGKSAKVDLGSGNNILAATALFAGKNFEVYGGDGSNTFTANTLVVNRNLSVGFGAGHDNLLFAGETFIGKSSRVYLNDGNDFAGFLPTQNSANASLQQSLHFDAGNGNDNLALDNNTGLNKRSHLDGNNGTDAIEQASAFAENIRIKNFENTSINDLNGILDSVYSQLSNAGIDPSIFGGSISSPIDLVLSSSTLNVGENDDPVSVDSGLLLNGNASQRILRAEVQISDFQSGQEILRFDNPNGIVGSFNANTGAMRLTGSALLADYQQALRDVTYENTSENPLTDTRQFEFSVTSNLETVTGTRDFRIVSANDAPVITLSNTNATVSPDDLPFVIDSLLTVTDNDNTQLESAVVAIATGFLVGEDILSFENVPGIVGTFDPSTGALTFSGDAAISAWQTVLRSVAYSNGSDDPTDGTRLLRFTVDDGQATDSADFELTVAADMMTPNQFSVSENASDGTVLGNVETENQFGTPMIYQFANNSIDPELLLNPDDHISGDRTAPVVLIEYLDFQCPACAAIHPTVNQLETDFAGDLLVVSRHFPLEAIHPNARAAARASEAAARQGMFEEMADLLFENQADWEFAADPTTFFEGFATDLSLDLTQFQNDVMDADVDARITRDADAAAGLGATGTPTFFLNGEPLDLPSSTAQFETAIQDAIQAIDQAFSVNRDTGQIVLNDNSLLDSAANPTVNLSVLVEDVSGNMETVDVVVNVTG